MNNRYTAVLLTITLMAAFVIGLFLEPSESRANARIGWAGEYFPNAEWAGDPAVVASDEVIEMNWFGDAPYEQLPSNNFSVHWTSTQPFHAGIYRFRVGADGSIRLLIDGKLVIEASEVDSFSTLTRDIRVPKGEHELEVYYAEQRGMAGALVDWTTAESPADVLDLVTMTTDQTTTTLPTPTAYIAFSQVNIYAQPSLSTARLFKASLAQHYPIVGNSDDGQWYTLVLPDGSQGWVEARYIYVNEQNTH